MTSPVHQHIFLSPHLDDAVLSCGGILAHLVNEGATVQVVSIFAGQPNLASPLSDFARYQHQMWGDPTEAYHTRQAEDKAALNSLGLQPTWLPFLDCIYRGQPEEGLWYYTSDDDIFGPLHPAEFGEVTAITQAIQTCLPPDLNRSESMIYSPLTVGNHVDHQLTFMAALQLLAQGYPVCFYEEFPYTDRDPKHITTALKKTTPTLINQAPGFVTRLKHTLPVQDKLWRSSIQLLPEPCEQGKIKAITFYQTQLAVLFGGEAAMRQRVRAYGELIGQGNPAERFWHLMVELDR